MSAEDTARTALPALMRNILNCLTDGDGSLRAVVRINRKTRRRRHLRKPLPPAQALPEARLQARRKKTAELRLRIGKSASPNSQTQPRLANQTQMRLVGTNPSLNDPRQPRSAKACANRSSNINSSNRKQTRLAAEIPRRKKTRAGRLSP